MIEGVFWHRRQENIAKRSSQTKKSQHFDLAPGEVCEGFKPAAPRISLIHSGSDSVDLK